MGVENYVNINIHTNTKNDLTIQEKDSLEVYLKFIHELMRGELSSTILSDNQIQTRNMGDESISNYWSGERMSKDGRNKFRVLANWSLDDKREISSFDFSVSFADPHINMRYEREGQASKWDSHTYYISYKEHGTIYLDLHAVDASAIVMTSGWVDFTDGTLEKGDFSVEVDYPI